MRQLRERITHSFRLEPLLRSDIEAYLDFRMRAAGYRGPNLFAPDAVRRIAKASEGLTRRVNILADKSLLAAFADDEHGITARHVDRAVRDSEFYRPPVSRAKIGLAAGGVAAGLALGLGLHYLLSPSAPSAATAQPAALAPAPVIEIPGAAMDPIQSRTAPAAASTGASTPAQQAIAQSAGVTRLTPAAVGATAAAAQTEPGAATAARAAGARPGSRNHLPPAPPAGDLTRARFSATQEWLNSAPSGHYSIQLLTAGTRDVRRIEDLLERAAARNLRLSDFHIYGVRINDEQHYRLAYGLFPTLAEAAQGIKDLPPAYLQFGPYYRSVARMRSQNQQ
jgi:septal ring-binding cell division protein DamX